MPKLAHHFKVSSPDEWINPMLTSQVIACDMGAEDLAWYLPKHRTNKLVLWLEDDATGLVMKTIRTWQAIEKLPPEKTFTLNIDLLNGAEHILETFTFLGCELEAIQHSLLTYAPRTDRIDLTVKKQGNERGIGETEITGSIFPGSISNTVMKLLQINFYEMKHKIITEDPNA